MSTFVLTFPHPDTGEEVRLSTAAGYMPYGGYEEDWEKCAVYHDPALRPIFDTILLVCRQLTIESVGSLGMPGMPTFHTMWKRVSMRHPATTFTLSATLDFTGPTVYSYQKGEECVVA